MSILTASGLSKWFGPNELFSGISLAVPQRARIGLVGINGIGKTTLLRILAGKEESSAGGVRLARGAQIGYLPQRPERFALGGRVAWVTPAKAPHGRSQGVGIAFENDDKSKAVRDAIEAALGDLLRSGRGTQTL